MMNGVPVRPGTPKSNALTVRTRADVKLAGVVPLPFSNLVATLREQKEDNLIVLGIMLPPGNSTQNVEKRRQIRYATQMALRAANFSPDDNKSLTILDLFDTGLDKGPVAGVTQDELKKMQNDLKVRLADISKKQIFIDQNPAEIAKSAKDGKIGLDVPNEMKTSAKSPQTGLDKDKAKLQKDRIAADKMQAAYDEKAKSWLVPAEFFMKQVDPKDPNGKQDLRPVMVLWLSEEYLQSDSDYFLERFDEAMHQLQQPPTVALFGPTYSSGLTTLALGEVWRSLLEKNNDLNGRPLFTERLPIPIYSYRATASTEVMREEFIGSIEGLKNLRGYRPITFDDAMKLDGVVRRVGPLDDELCTALLEELDRRNVTLTIPKGSGPDPGQIVLLGEWETPFGRGLKETFDRKLDELAQKKNADKVRVAWYPYLAGLDLGLKASSNLASAGTNSTAGLGTVANLEKEVENNVSNTPRAFGDEQLDYLKRLADRIILHESGANVRAIGILGTDVFDKISILRALRETFPGAVFFTTNLDAQMLDPRNTRWTRNLVVASPFGLNLPDTEELKLNGWTPPFRATSQTALFYSLLDALYHANASSYQPPRDIRPHIFEIGRHTAVDLTPMQAPQDYDPTGNPNTRSWTKIETLIYGVVTAVFSFGLAWLLALRIRGLQMEYAKTEQAGLPVEKAGSWSLRQPRWKWLAPLIWVAGCFGVLFAFAWLIAVDAASGIGEPWNLLEGISLWPTEILRALALLLCGYFALMIYLQLQIVRVRLNRRFGLVPIKAPETQQKGLARIPESFVHWKRHLQGLKVKAGHHTGGAEPLVEKSGKQIKDAAEIWNDFTHILLSIWFWVFIGIGGMLMGGVIYHEVIVGDHPYMPVRGPIITDVNHYLMLASTMAVSVLLLLVWIITWQTIRFIRAISHPENKWPPSTYWQDLVGSQFFDLNDAGRKSDLSKTAITDNYESLVFLDPLYNLRFIAAMTQYTGEFVIYPFIVLLVVLISRIDLLDQFDWTPWYTIAMFGVFTVSVLLGLTLRYVAEKRRGESLRYFQRLAGSAIALTGYLDGRIRVSPTKAKTSATVTPPATPATGAGGVTILAENDTDRMKERGELAKRAGEEIEHLHIGVFSPLAQNPVLWAVLTPLTGMGGINILQYFIR